MNIKGENGIYSFYLRHIVHFMKRRQDEQLIPYNLTNQQARLLGDINEMLEAGHDISRHDLEEAMHLRGSSITSLLQGLEKKDFILRISGNEDGRTKKLRITKQGSDLIGTMNEVLYSSEQQLLIGMTEKEQQEFKRLLSIAYKNIMGDGD